MNRVSWIVLLVAALGAGHSETGAKDYFLTIGGGYSPSGNQASLEKNVLFFQRLLHDQKLSHLPTHIYFADGDAEGRNVQVKDLEAIPLANRLMAELFSSTRNLGMQYRSHQVPDIQGETSPENLRKWFHEVGETMQPGDRLILYVTAHGGKSSDRDNPYDTTIYMWNNRRVKVSELVEMLDTLPQGVSVVTMMVQCHAGGFSRILFNGGKPERGLSDQHRCGFFATVYDRAAAGCTPEVNEANYEEYSTYFWAAIAGQSRTGRPIEVPDYDQNGQVSFDEAHAYTVLTSDTIDLPIKTSGEYLRVHSRFGDSPDSPLLPDNAPYSTILKLAGPSELAILDGLSEKLDLSGEERLARARARGSESSSRSSQSSPPSGRGRSSNDSPERQLRQKIANDLKAQWPELANVLNPLAIELLTVRADEFVRAVEAHPDYKEYRELTAAQANRPNSVKQRVKYERFVRTAENVILAENLRRLADAARLVEYQRIVAGEAGTLQQAGGLGR